MSVQFRETKHKKLVRLDWSGNPYECSKCFKIDKFPNSIEMCECYPYTYETIKCKHCGNEEDIGV